jgi:hypothetical protein
VTTWYGGRYEAVDYIRVPYQLTHTPPTSHPALAVGGNPIEVLRGLSYIDFELVRLYGTRGIATYTRYTSC